MPKLPTTLMTALAAFGMIVGMALGPAQSATVGIAVGGIGSDYTDQVASGSVIKKSKKHDTGTIKFYIPLSDSSVNEDANPSGIFGVDDYRKKPKKKAKKVGTRSDSCNGGCDGHLDMFIHFSGLNAGNNQFSFKFDDLDLIGDGNNDPDFFAESLEIAFFDAGANSLGAVSSFSNVSDDGVAFADGRSQLLLLSLATNGDAWAHLRFESHLFGGTGSNTIERLFASAEGTFSLNVNNVAPVPVPGALPLFLTGLAAFGVMGARRRRRVSRDSADHSGS